MRTIKFRAWDKINKQMSIVRELGWAPQGHAPFITDIALKPLSDKGIEKLRVQGKNPNYYKVYSDDCILMQFTGLLDKNGKEIYETDIVDQGGIKGKVYFDEGDGEASFRIDFGEGMKQSIYSEHCKIIGNIYENPELLK